METPEQKVQCKVDVKYDWYQTEVSVVVTILVRNVQKEKTDISFTNNTVSVRLSLPDDTEHVRELHLAHDVVPQSSSYIISPAKVEVKLRKLIGVRWEKLEGTTESNQKIQNCPGPSDPHKYPTSTGKNWSVIEKSIKEQEENEKPAGEDALNKLFQDIYGKGDDNLKRAMNKSYMESGGTVLSTNWKEIAKDRVDIKPPDGMEWKKWDS